MARLGDFLPLDETTPASSIAPNEEVANLVMDGLDPDYKGMPATPSSPWVIYALIALAIYFLMGEE